MHESDKSYIDTSTYQELLRRWRYGRAGDPLFIGETGQYYAARMAVLITNDPAEHVRASKAIG